MARWGGGSIQRRYDSFGNTTGVLLPGAAADVLHPGYGFQYDNLDRPTGVYAAGLSGEPDLSSAFGATFQVGGASRLYSTTTNGGLRLKHTRAYGPVAEGSRLSALAIVASGITGSDPSIGSFTFGWDVARSSKTRRTTSGGSSVSNLTASMGWVWGYDAAHRLRSATAGQGTEEPIAGSTHPFGDWTFQYGSADELLSVQEVSSGYDTFDSGLEGRVTGRHGQGQHAAFGYDGEGRRTSDDRFDYTYDWRGLLVQVDVKASAPAHAGEQVLYTYDAVGRLLTRKHLGPLDSNGEREHRGERLFVWDGAILAAEVGLNHEGAVIWRTQYAPGPGGPDTALQVRVETNLLEGGSSKLYAYVHDELGSVIGIMEDAAPAEGEPPLLLARYVYTPFGEAHIEQGPGLLSIEFDESVTAAGGLDQDPPQPGTSVSGALRVQTSLPIDPGTLEDGITIQRKLGTEWVDVDPASGEIVVAADDGDPTRVYVLRREGWYAQSAFRVTLEPTLKDTFGRPITLPAGQQGGLSVEINVPADGETPPPCAQVFPSQFDSSEAAGALFGGAFPGGQTRLFHGLWTDPVTGIGYARNRWYDPRNATWLSGDAMGMNDSANLYAFVGWSPHAAVDPLGLEMTFRDWLGVFIDYNVQMATNPFENLQRALGGVEGLVSMTAGTAKGTYSLLCDLNNPMEEGAKQRNEERLLAIADFVEHPVDTVVEQHKRSFDEILKHEARGEYWASGATASQLAAGDALAVSGVAMSGLKLVQAARLGVAVGATEGFGAGLRAFGREITPRFLRPREAPGEGTAFGGRASRSGGEILEGATWDSVPRRSNPSGRLTYDSATRSWKSPGGLGYGQGSVHGNRVKHVLDHLVPNSAKKTHSIFNVKRRELIGLLDEAWARRGAHVPGDPGAYVIDMGPRVIGTTGQTQIKMIVRPGTQQVITAYPW